MQYNKIPKTDLSVSQISFGCMSLKGDDEVNERLIHHAIDHGINYFDTADLYDSGRNEETVGKALKGKRSSIIVATKVGNEMNADGTSWKWNPTKAYILRAVDKSLQRLQTDYIDIYQLHGGTIDDPIDETIEAFEILKTQGKIRAYGISSIRPNVIREYVSKSTMVSTMIQYSLLDRRPEEKMLDLLDKNDIAVMVRGAVAKGLLIDKQAKDYLGHSSDEVEQAQTLINQQSVETRSPAQTSMQYVLRHKAVSSAVVGIRTEAQLNDAIKTTTASQLTEQEYQNLGKSIVAKVYEKHR